MSGWLLLSALAVGNYLFEWLGTSPDWIDATRITFFQGFAILACVLLLERK